MTIDELDEEFMKMCDSNKVCDECKYSHPCLLSYGYDKGRADMKREIKELAHEDVATGNMIISLTDVEKLKEQING